MCIQDFYLEPKSIIIHVYINMIMGPHLTRDLKWPPNLLYGRANSYQVYMIRPAGDIIHDQLICG